MPCSLPFWRFVMISIRSFRTWGGVLLAAGLPLCAQQATRAEAADPAQRITVDAHGTATPFPHFWEQMFGSGRANLTMRGSYRADLHEVKEITDLRYVRFHAIFHDENGVYSEDAQGNPIYNWSYVDQIYDGLLAEGVRPYVEIGFMPRSEEHTSELQSLRHLVCRLLLEKK